MPRSGPPKCASAIALFRYGVVSEVRTRIARGQLRADAVRETARRFHHGPNGAPRRAGHRSVYRWLAAFEKRGLAGLEDAPRTTSTDGVLEPALVAFLLQEKRGDTRASVPELLRRAVVEGLLHQEHSIDRTTVWRAMKRRAVDMQRAPRVRDQRRFSYAHRLQLVMCDGKHFRAGPTAAKRVALFFIDDASRYIPEVVVGTSETAELFLRGIFRLLQAVGRVDGIYVDRGSGFIAHDSCGVIANLGFAHILGEKAYPQARGKIERFNQTADADILRHLTGDDVDPHCAALELRIAHYLHSDYNRRPHTSLGRGETPRARFLADERPLAPYADMDALRNHFFVNEVRKVSNDHVISIDSRKWEVPRGLAQQKITVRRDVFEPLHLLLEHGDKVLRLSEVDLVQNAHTRRARAAPAAPETPTSSSGAALTAAEGGLAPITQPDGGFSAPDLET